MPGRATGDIHLKTFLTLIESQTAEHWSTIWHSTLLTGFLPNLLEIPKSHGVHYASFPGMTEVFAGKVDKCIASPGKF